MSRVKDLKLSVTREEIAKLANDIKKALASLTGIDDILQETEERLNSVNNLKERAEQARAKAVAVSDVISSITDALVKAAGSQATAQNATRAAEEDIKIAQDVITRLLSGLDALENAIDAAQSNVTEIAGEVPLVQKQFAKNIEQLNITEKNALDAHDQSQTARKEVDELFDLLKEAQDKRNSKAISVEVTATNVTNLKKKVEKLLQNLGNKHERLIVVEKRITTLESLVNETRILQEETKVFLKKLEDRQKCYLECNPNFEFNACFED